MTNNDRLRPLAAGVFSFAPKIVLLQDGTLMAFCGVADHRVQARYSRDNGTPWTEAQSLFELPAQLPETIGVVEAVASRDGEVHAFLLHGWKPDSRGEGERGGPGTYFGDRIDIWHTRTEGGRARWQPPKCIWQGYTGALNSCIQLSSGPRRGRILLPFSYYVNRTWSNRGEGLEAFSFYGMFKCVVIYSDDSGATWALSNDLKTVVPDISYAYGACEPVVLEMRDGRVWMLMRTQMGWFYESFSDDGATWSRPRPSRIRSSDSPAGLVRLKDGRLVLCWNNCLRFPYAYGGRQVIHAAVSADEGQTWRGCREVGRDPLRNEPPPPDGDFGTAYPFPVVTGDGAVLISTGQGKGRTLLMRMDPAYMEETEQSADFPKGLDDWSVFGTRGVEVVPNPQGAGDPVLRLQTSDDEFPAAAVWNFPLGRTGRLQLKLMVEKGNQGVVIGLTDHFSPPFDFEDVLNNVFNLDIGPDGRIGGRGRFARGRWHDLELNWDCDKRRCLVIADGRRKCLLAMRRETEGVSYLRLRCLAETPEAGALMVESVKATVSAV